MPQIRIIQPIMQTTGEFRLLDWLNESFRSDSYDAFRCLVAFAKAKPLYKLHENLRRWKNAGKTAEAIIGIDHKGTSAQALRYVLSNYDHAYVLHAAHATFHPKLYIFSGAAKAAVYYGSNNLTSGGLETNFEGGILLNLSLPEDQHLLEQAKAAFDSLLPASVPCCTELTETVLETLAESGLLLDEAARWTTRGAGIPAGGQSALSGLFAPYRTKPPRALSKTVMAAAAGAAGIGAAGNPAALPEAGAAAPAVPAAPICIVDGLVMQVIPAANGEIRLSKIAVNQNPGFFGFPFTGRTTPKKASNPTYPQRDPDPVVNIYVYDPVGTCVNREMRYNLNTVYYEKKAELRITITSALLEGLGYSSGTNYPIMVMRVSAIPGCDYDLHFYAQGSAEYDSYLNICDQALPSGGKPVARKMGWI